MNAPRNIPELLMPAGGFDQAIAAIEGGADALYFGFADFSARMLARNFDRLEYRRLYKLARDRGIRLYATLNTVLLEMEIEAVSALLAFLGRFPPDAVLVQDWGLASLIRERHPGIAIHASTQTAVQGAEAARIAKELGASRIVLPRETSLAEMARLREEEPSLEYEAFVHGALCYSFSGLCLASGMVLGRSGNRGECAQLCRSYYDVLGSASEGPAAPKTDRNCRGYWFSCRDLELGERVRQLAEAGIRSLKVEGRMKGPEYCYAAARLYRGILDRLSGEGPGDAEIEARRKAARIAFSRSPTEGWLSERGGSRLIDPEYPGHRGIPAGRIRSIPGSRIVVELVSDLGLRDGLLGFEEDDPFRPFRFPATGLRDPRSGRELFKAKAGERVELDAPFADGRRGRFAVGAELYRISARDMDRRAVSQEEYEAARENLGLELRIRGGKMGAVLCLPRFDDAAAPGPRVNLEEGDRITLDEARAPGGFAKALRIFDESGSSDFRLIPTFDSAAKVELEPGEGASRRSCSMVGLFVPPSELKREKNRLYELAAREVAKAEAVYAMGSATWCGDLPRSAGAAPSVQDSRNWPPRKVLVLPRGELPSGMPFVTRRDLVDGSPLPSWGGRVWMPLAPLVIDRGEYEKLVLERAERELNEGKTIMIGLGALHHFAIARKMDRRVRFFLDFNLYIANHLSLATLSGLVDGMDFAYRYIEADLPDGFPGSLASIGADFEPPLFQSLGCALKHHINSGECPPGCPRSWSTSIQDRDRRYRVLVEDCVTMLFRESGPTGGTK